MKQTAQTSKNYSFIWDDQDYDTALNYEQSLYNYPITFNIQVYCGTSMVRTHQKYILPFGTMDSKTVKQSGNLFYIVGENRGLNYISMVVIDTENSNIQTVFLQGEDLDNPDAYSYGLLGAETDEQIRIMSEWLQ